MLLLPLKDSGYTILEIQVLPFIASLDTSLIGNKIRHWEFYWAIDREFYYGLQI